MRVLKLIGLTIFGLLKQVCLIPQSVAIAIQQRRARIVRNEVKTERLDRIRNPAKYLGQ